VLCRIKPKRLAIGATLRSAHCANAGDFKVTKHDLHQQIRGKSANLILFIVDASGSMAAQRRMEAVKGAVLTLLTDAYQQRDQVALSLFAANPHTCYCHDTQRRSLPSRTCANSNRRERLCGMRYSWHWKP